MGKVESGTLGSIGFDKSLTGPKGRSLLPHALAVTTDFTSPKAEACHNGSECGVAGGLSLRHIYAFSPEIEPLLLVLGDWN